MDRELCTEHAIFWRVHEHRTWCRHGRQGEVAGVPCHNERDGGREILGGKLFGRRFVDSGYRSAFHFWGVTVTIWETKKVISSLVM